MGRLLTIAIIVGTIAALCGGLAGLAMAQAVTPLPEHRVWFIWLSALLTGSVALMATLVAVRARQENGNDLRQALASVLVGGCAGAVLAQRLFETSPRGRQLLFFALGALIGGSLFAASRRLRRPMRRLADRPISDNQDYSASGVPLLLDLHAVSLPIPIVEILLERRSRGRWFQFTLGSLLAFMLISSVLLALWARGPIKRRQVLAAIDRSGGGRVAYASRAPDWIVDMVGDLARGIFDEVDGVQLWNADDADLARVGALSRLRWLSLAGNVTDEAIGAVAQWESLEELDLGGTAASSKGLAELRRLPRLRSLSAPTSLNDDGLAEISSLRNLRKLRLYSDHRFRPPAWGPLTVGGLDHLRNLAQLEELQLAVPSIGDDDIAFLEELPRLRRLDLSGTNLSDDGLKHLARLQELEWLDLRRTRVTGSGFKDLSALAQLRMLHLGGAPVSDEGLAEIANLVGLQSLDLDGTRITDPGLVHLKSLRKLSWLNIMSTGVSNEGLVGLEGLTGLGSFHHERTNITAEGIARLERIWQERRAALQPAE